MLGWYEVYMLYRYGVNLHVHKHFQGNYALHELPGSLLAVGV